MTRYVESAAPADDLPRSGCAFAAVGLTAGAARRQAPQGARPVARERTKRGLCFPHAAERIAPATD